MDYITDKGREVEQVAGDAREAVDYADQINNQNKLYVDNTIEEYKQYADMKLEESAEKALQAGESARMAQQSETTAIEMAEEAGKKAEEAGKKAEEAWKSAEDSKGYAEQCAGVAGFDGTASTVSAIDTQGIAVRKASGTGHVTIENAAEHPILNLDLAGKSEQAVTTGAQLFNAYNLSLNNATATITESGRVIKAVGKNTSASNLYANIDISKVAGKTVYLQGDQISKDNGTIQMQLRVKKADGTYRYATSTNAVERNIKLSLEINSDDTELVLFLYCRSASDLDNVSIFENVRVGIAESAWEPYTGAKPSPSPDYPQPIISTGTVSTGAQMFDASKIPTKSAGGATVTNNGDGSFIVSGNGALTGTFKTYYRLTREEVLKTFRPGIYTLSADVESYPKPGVAVRYIADNSLVVDFGLFGGVMNKTAEITQEMIDDESLYFELYFYGSAGTTIVPGTVKPMLSAGASVKPWEPYTGGKPSPSPDYPQTMDVTVTGAQLIDASKIPDRSSGGITVTNTSAGSIISGEGPITTKFDLRTILTHEETMGLLGNERTFTLSSDTVVYPYFFFNFYDKNGGVMNLQLSGTNQVTKTLPDVADIDTLYVQYGYFGNKDVSIVAGNQKVMLNTGPTALPWQPYQSGTASITLTEPLHGVGDYRDRIMCKDGEWGIERYISHYKLTSDIVSASSGGVTTTNNIIDNRYTVITCEAWKNTLKKELYENGKKTIGFCTIAPPGMINDWNTSKNGKENVYTINAAGAMYISIPISSLGITANATRGEVTAAVKQYVADNDVYVMFVLDTPTWEPLPAAAQSALNALTTYTGTTHINITAGGPEPDVGLEYFGQPGDKVTVQDMCDSFAAPAFDDSGVVQGISGFGDFLNRMTSGMRFPSFFRDLKAGLKFVLHTGQLVNNGLCNEPGKYPLDAAYGRTLLEMIGNTANLPGGAADIVSAIVTQNSNFSAEIYDGNIDTLHKNCVVQIISGRTTGTFPNVNYTGSFLSVVNNGPNFTSQRIDIITNKNTASYKRSWYYGNYTDYPGWSPWILDMSNADIIHGNTDAFSVPANGEHRVTLNLSQYNVGTDYRLYATVRGSTWVNLGAIYCNNNQAIIDLRNLNTTAVNVTLWYTIIRK